MAAAALAVASSCPTGDSRVKEPKVLLAKTPRDPAKPQWAETLVGHIDNVVRVSEVLIDAVGVRSLESLGLQASWLDSLREALVRSACLHDLGKANSQFQRALQPGRQPPQAIRHEVVGTWLPLAFRQLDAWLFRGCSEATRWVVLLAVLGHHLQVRDGQSVGARDGSGETKIDVFCDHSDFYAALSLASKLSGLGGIPPVLRRREIDLLSSPVLPELQHCVLEATEWHESADSDTRRLFALTKVLLITADVAGSAVPRKGLDPGQWTGEVLARVCLSDELDGIARTRLQEGQRLRVFQQGVAESKRAVTFVRAGCGSGKTVAAYLWASQRAAGRKLFFCYPTTGTATEGYRDYVPAEMSPDVALLHSRAEFDLEYVVKNPEDNTLHNAMRIESLVSWDKPLVLCTVDQVLSLIQNGRKALFSSPALLNGAFVFDEIHQYDTRLFSALLRFVDSFRGAPILLMTASLPPARLSALRKLLSDRGEELSIIEGPADLEQIPRYTIRGREDEPPWTTIEEALSSRGKVLWVANTVDRCTDFAAQAQQHGHTPMVYHSRFRYLDRIDKHNAVINGFKGPEHVLAVTTQVCEVSLDLSADLLVTDLAPAPALIQRMGRLNRRVSPEEECCPKPVVVLSVPTRYPYEQEDLSEAQKWLDILGSGPHSQEALASAFEQVRHGEQVYMGRSEWLDGGPFAGEAPLREAGTTIPVIRTEDEPMCVGSEKRPVTKQITRYAIPMPLGPVASEISGWKRLGFAFVAPAGRIDYSDEWGAKWHEE